MNEYIVTVTAVVEADDHDGAIEKFREWLHPGDRDVEVTLVDPERWSDR